jgi:signal transduction histidine kinase
VGNAVYESILARLVPVSPLLARGVLDSGLEHLGFDPDHITASQMMRVIDEFLVRELEGVDIEGGGGGMVVAGPHGVTFLSPSLAVLLGLTRERDPVVLERHLAEMEILIPAGTLPHHQDQATVVVERPFRRVLCVGRCAIPLPGGELQRVSFLRDETLQEALRAEVGQVQQALDDANRTRERLSRDLLTQERETTRSLQRTLDAQSKALVQTEKLASVGVLLGGIAHELNNLLGPILGHAQRLQGRELATEEREAVAQIELAARSAAGVVHSLLSMASPRAGDRERADLNRVAAEVCDLFGGQWGQWGIELTLELTEDLPRTTAESGQVRSVLINLLANASQAVGRRPGRIVVRTSLVDHEVVLDVEDTGGGIDDDLLDRMFEPFVTGRAHEDGIGMGLHIVERNVAAVGGRIEARNVERAGQRGARLRVWLPVHAHPRPTPEGLTPVSPGESRAVGGNRSCLVVDDEPVLLSLMCDVLRDEGFVVDGASSATEALERVTARPYDLVVSDVRMPEMDGFELLEHLDAWRIKDRCAFLFVTGDVIDPQLRERIQELGAAVLYKPFELEAFLSAVFGVLGED